MKVVKNKVAPPFREAEFEILFGTGVNKLGELVDTAEKLGLMEKAIDDALPKLSTALTQAQLAQQARGRYG